MRNRFFCCWTYKGWSLCVAWFQIVTQSILTLAYLGTLITVWSGGNAHLEKYGLSTKSTSMASVLLIAFILLSLAGVIFGIILLRQIRQMDAIKLRRWLIIQVVLIAFRTIVVIVGIANGDVLSLGVLISIGILVFSMFVVYQYRKDILDQATTSNLQMASTTTISIVNEGYEQYPL